MITRRRRPRRLRSLKNLNDCPGTLDHFKAVIHDLRIKRDGLSAQIDHLIIGRLLDIYVLESKHFASGVQITDDGQFYYFYKNRPVPIPSPIEQNKRHIHLLSRFLEENDLLPTRLGIKIKPSFKSFILVSPTSRLTKPKTGTFDTSMVIKADQFMEQFNKDLEDASLISIAKVISVDTLKSFAERLALCHKTLTIDYEARFGLNAVVSQGNVAEAGEAPKPSDSKAIEQVQPNDEVADDKGAYAKKSARTGYFCAKCRKDISKKVAMFCFTNKDKFGGKAYCFECQKEVVPNAQCH